ncbi:hypothetical protein MLD38_012199 [Melastoma candidum]|uniref:Uncharacterized protein n=1 Tax=Melastoma candidum TaxID=119954 RepID=A0ACB9R5P2_9MYRT|nr:hypothetical protein MLD38_012199 [Melastoma candidum]
MKNQGNTGNRAIIWGLTASDMAAANQLLLLTGKEGDDHDSFKKDEGTRSSRKRRKRRFRMLSDIYTETEPVNAAEDHKR